MFKNKMRALSVAAGLIAVLAMTMGTSETAFASSPPGGSQNTTGSLTIASEASLTITAPASLTFSGVILDGSQHTTTNAAGSFPVDVTDASGLAGGWDVSLAATTFTHNDNKLSDTGTLSVTSLNATDLSTDHSGTLPASSVTPASATPIAITTAAANPTPAAIYNAGALSGMGSFELNTQLSLYLPASTIADTYTSTITVAVASRIQ